jgi:hypothetical protein
MVRQTIILWLAVLGAFVGVSVAYLAKLIPHAKQPNYGSIGQPHRFQLKTAPPFLSEALAVEKAKEAIALEGYDLGYWKLREKRRTTAPDGTPDVFFVRRTHEDGDITFEYQGDADKPPKIPPTVSVALRGYEVSCHVLLPR